VKPFYAAVFLAAAMTAGSGDASAFVGAADADFERLRSLVGEWHGTVQWTGARTDTGEMDAVYSLTGHGTAVVENLVSGGETIMTSVYHLDGPTLRMTHYCGAGNQPRLRAEPGDPSRPDRLRFVFVDATNLGDPPRPHVDGVELRFVDAAHAELSFHFTSPKGESVERIALTRATPSRAR
jgi:hypothetical protein